MQFSALGLLQLTKLTRAIKEIDSDAIFKLSVEEDQINLLTCAAAFAADYPDIEKSLIIFWDNASGELKEHLLREGVVFNASARPANNRVLASVQGTGKKNDSAPVKIKIPTGRMYRGKSIFEEVDVNSPAAQVYMEKRQK